MDGKPLLETHQPKVPVGIAAANLVRLLALDGDREAETNAVAAALMRESAWKSQMIVAARSGEPRPLLANAQLVFKNASDMRECLAFDVFSQSVTLIKKSPWGTLGKWTDDDSSQACIWLQRDYGVHVHTGLAFEAAATVARENPFHPVKQYLQSLTWDGTQRVEQAAALYFGAQNDDYARAVFQRWLIAAVARIYRPGCKADCVLILEGKQGLKNRLHCGPSPDSGSQMRSRTSEAKMQPCRPLACGLSSAAN